MNFDTIKEKVGPLPIWAWGVIVGAVGLLVFYVVKSRKDKTTGAPIPQPGYGSAADDLGLVTPSGAVGSVIDGGSVETNQTWLAKAVSYLSTQGYNSADAAVWVQAFLTGLPIVGAEGKAAIRAALDRFGTPPDTSYGLPVFVDETPTTPTDTKKPKLYYVEANRTWGLIFPGGTQQTTTSQTAANAWASQYGNAVTVTPAAYQAAFNASKGA